MTFVTEFHHIFYQIHIRCTGRDCLPAVFQVLRLVHAHDDFDLELVGAMLAVHLHLVPLGRLGTGGSRSDQTLKANDAYRHQ